MIKTYRTKSGDMWDTISLNTFGDVKYTDKIMSANPKYIGIYRFPAGVEINIPDLDITNTSDDMPPWKKVSG